MRHLVSLHLVQTDRYLGLLSSSFIYQFPGGYQLQVLQLRTSQSDSRACMCQVVSQALDHRQETCTSPHGPWTLHETVEDGNHNTSCLAASPPPQIAVPASCRCHVGLSFKIVLQCSPYLWLYKWSPEVEHTCNILINLSVLPTEGDLFPATGSSGIEQNATPTFLDMSLKNMFQDSKLTTHTVSGLYRLKKRTRIHALQNINESVNVYCIYVYWYLNSYL